MNEIAINPHPAAPPTANPILARALDVLLSGAVTTGGETILLPGKELAPEHRRMAEGRLSILSRSLDERDHAAVSAAILRLMAGFPSIRQTGDDARAVLASYLMMVADFPPWAVSAGCRRWLVSAKQEGHSLAFPPSAAQLREQCQGVVRRHVEERAKLVRALGATSRPRTAAEEARVSAGFDELKRQLGAGQRMRREPTLAEARAALERRCAQRGIDPAVIDETPDRKPVGRSLAERRTEHA